MTGRVIRNRDGITLVRKIVQPTIIHRTVRPPTIVVDGNSTIILKQHNVTRIVERLVQGPRGRAGKDAVPVPESVLVKTGDSVLDAVPIAYFSGADYVIQVDDDQQRYMRVNVQTLFVGSGIEPSIYLYNEHGHDYGNLFGVKIEAGQLQLIVANKGINPINISITKSHHLR